MKKLVYMFLLVGSLLIGANVANAAGDGSKKEKARSRYITCTDQTTQIKDLIGSPDLRSKEAASAIVEFSISENNVISVTDVKTENAKLKQQIIKSLNGKKIQGNEVAMKDQTLNLYFAAQKEQIFTIY